jgi:hypothetical protein
MEEINKIEKMFADVKDYAETRIDIVSLNAQDKISGIMSSIASIMILGVLLIFTVMFLSISGAWALGEYLHSPSIGFLIVAAFYLLIGIVLYIKREDWIKMPIINSILKKITFHENN